MVVVRVVIINNCGVIVGRIEFCMMKNSWNVLGLGWMIMVM